MGRDITAIDERMTALRINERTREIIGDFAPHDRLEERLRVMVVL